MSSFVTRTKPQSEDAKLSRTIARSLATSGYVSLCSVNVSVHEGFVTLEGHLPTYYLKQIAQSIVMQHQYAGFLRNNIEII